MQIATNQQVERWKVGVKFPERARLLCRTWMGQSEKIKRQDRQRTKLEHVGFQLAGI